ncbi:hypothetical protein D3C71_949470 [compost metagenome]
MPLDAERGEFGRETAADHHGKRCARHHEGHQRIRADTADHAGDETLRADNLRKRPYRFDMGGGSLGVGQFQKRQNGNRNEAERNEGQKSAGKGNRRKQILAEDGELRPDDGGNNAASQNPGDRLRLVEGWRGIGCGEANFLRETAGNANQQQADGKQPEIRPEERHRSNAAADGAHQRADHEACLAAKKAGGGRHADRAERDTDIKAGERRGCQ